MDHASSPDAAETGSAVRRRRRVFALVGSTLVAVLVLGGLTWLTVSVLNDEPQTAEEADGFTAYREDWESAMRKAGVETTFPAGPVDVEDVQAEGRRSFSATFTPEEVSALLFVYRYRSNQLGDRIGMERVQVSFPEAQRAVLEGEVLLNGESFHARAEAPTSFASGRIVLNQGAGTLTVEGFPVSGKRRDDAMLAISDYLNSLLSAAPGLEIETAEIAKGSVRVEGTAPERIVHPDPLSPAAPGTIMASDEES